ncbi:11084_t:CDS:1 [Ambispora gerdemannii]|uniref:11084_t:CDS:1 n=1 Tax=Ambispora gerdemannii TaxID=144530 RepID=A0A9N8V1F2_9GLOM|nr:11084_t:CDS:1 [Ambispora gerdemannii]
MRKQQPLIPKTRKVAKGLPRIELSDNCNSKARNNNDVYDEEDYQYPIDCSQDLDHLLNYHQQQHYQHSKTKMHKRETCRHSSLLHSKHHQQIQQQTISNGQLPSFKKSKSGNSQCRDSRSPVVQEEQEISFDDIKMLVNAQHRIHKVRLSQRIDSITGDNNKQNYDGIHKNSTTEEKHREKEENRDYRDLSTHELVMRNRLLHEKVQRRIKLLKRIFELRKRGETMTNNGSTINTLNINGNDSSSSIDDDEDDYIKCWERMMPDKVSWNAFLEMTKKVDKK